MTGQTNAGGAGGLSTRNALLHVNAPLGSTIELAKGGVTVKTIPPAQAFPNVDGTTADYYYSITPSNFGAWTVTASLSGRSASAAVTVDAVAQYDVKLIYILYLFNGGAVSPYVFTKKAGAEFTVGSTIYVHANPSATAWGIATPAVDLTLYSTLHMNVSSIGQDVDGRSKLYISATESATMAASVGATGTGDFAIDVSAYSGLYYVGLYTNNYGSFTVDKIWAES